MAQISLTTDTTTIPGKTVNVIPAQTTKCYRVAYDPTTKKVVGKPVYADTLVTRYLGGLLAYTTWAEVQAAATTLGLTGLPTIDPATGG